MCTGLSSPDSAAKASTIATVMVAATSARCPPRSRGPLLLQRATISSTDSRSAVSSSLNATANSASSAMMRCTTLTESQADVAAGGGGGGGREREARPGARPTRARAAAGGGPPRAGGARGGAAPACAGPRPGRGVHSGSGGGGRQGRPGRATWWGGARRARAGHGRVGAVGAGPRGRARAAARAGGGGGGPGAAAGAARGAPRGRGGGGPSRVSTSASNCRSANASTVAPRGPPHSRARPGRATSRARVARDAQQRRVQRQGVIGRHQQAILAVRDRGWDAAHASAHHRTAEGARLDQHARRALAAAGHRQHVGVGILAEQRRPEWQVATQGDPPARAQRRHRGSQLACRAALVEILLADDHELAAWHVVTQARIGRHQHVEPLLGAQIADEQHAEWRPHRPRPRDRAELRRQQRRADPDAARRPRPAVSSARRRW